MKKNEIKQLTDVQHILQRSGIYLGSIQPVEQKGYFYNEVENKFEYKDFTYVPAFCKIINEIIDNALDEAIRTNFKHANEIHVTVTKDTIKVSDNGRGVPCDIDSTGKVSQLELAFCNARAGSNFDDSGRNTIGMNGVGSFCTNCFSTLFKVNSVTKTAKGVLTCKDNLSSKRCSITPGKFTNKETGTTVEFMPDLKRFGLTTIDDNHMNLIYQRMLFLSISYPEVTFKYNKKAIKFKNAKNFLNAFSDKYAVISDEKYMIGVLPNSYDDFVSKSFVNGADCINGGNHIDYIHSEVVGRLKEKLEKKYPNIKHGDIKNKLTYVVTFRDFENAQFDSQTKEKLANNVNDIKKFLDTVDWDKFVANIYKVDAILDPIIESFKIKEELKNRQALTKMGKTTKTFKCEKFLPATKNNTYFAIVEGDCLEENTLIKCINENENVQLKDINIGDLVLTHKQNIKEVVNKSSKLIECLKIKTKSGKEIICSANHRLFVYDTISNTFKFKKLKEININTDKLINNKLAHDFIFDNINIEPYVDANNTKYTLKIFGTNYCYYSSEEHKYIVFNKETYEFNVKSARELIPTLEYMVLLPNNQIKSPSKQYK